MVGVYQFNRRKKKLNGTAYFYCNEKGCNASIRATYVEDIIEPVDARVINEGHSHLPDVCKQYIDLCEKKH